MAKWVEPNGLACHPIEKKLAQVKNFSLLACINLTRQPVGLHDRLVVG